MYRMVIIDDESVIVEGVQRMMDWAGHNCTPRHMTPPPALLSSGSTTPTSYLRISRCRARMD